MIDNKMEELMKQSQDSTCIESQAQLKAMQAWRDLQKETPGYSPYNKKPPEKQLPERDYTSIAKEAFKETCCGFLGLLLGFAKMSAKRGRWRGSCWGSYGDYWSRWGD